MTAGSEVQEKEDSDLPHRDRITSYSCSIFPVITQRIYHSPLPTPERNAFICKEDFFCNERRGDGKVTEYPLA